MFDLIGGGKSQFMMSDNAKYPTNSPLTFFNTKVTCTTGMNNESTSPLIFISLFHSMVDFGNYNLCAKFYDKNFDQEYGMPIF
jgi:hypothetical protein